MRFLTMEVMFLRGDDVAASSLLPSFLDTKENTPEDFFLRRFIGLLLSSSVWMCTEWRVGATSPTLSDLESLLNKVGSRLTLCVRPRRRGVLWVSDDESKASARRRSGILTVAVLPGDVTEVFERREPQSGGEMIIGDDGPENRDRPRGDDSGRSGILSWM